MAAPTFAEAIDCFRAGRLRDAEALCANLRAADPAHVEAWHLGGVIAERLGNLNLGAALVQKAVALQPDNAEARRNLGSLLARQGRTGDALPHFETAARLLPRDTSVLNSLARARSDMGDTAGAIDAWKASIVNTPGQAAIQFSLAVACQNLGRIEEATAAFRACVEIEPSRGEAWLRLGHALSILCRLDEALACYREAETRGLADRAAVMAVATLCPMESSAASLDERRTAMAAGFAALDRRRIALSDPYSEIALTNFYLAYHGRDNRALNQAAAKFYLGACPGLAWSAPHLAKTAGLRPGRPRIGFVSPYFYSHSTGKMLRGLIERRDSARYEAILFRAGGQDDAVWRSMAAAGDKTMTLPRDLAGARAMIAARRAGPADLYRYRCRPLYLFSRLLAPGTGSGRDMGPCRYIRHSRDRPLHIVARVGAAWCRGPVQRAAYPDGPSAHLFCITCHGAERNRPCGTRH